MWTLNKPSLEKARGEDLDNLVLYCRALSDLDKPLLKRLYEQYDSQNGSVTSAQHAAVPADKASAIKGQYYKTDKGGTHYYMRDELEKKVDRCPYCSINQPSTLDHYMPQSEYPALAMCRLNLVPMCGDCNREKNNHPFSLFIHSYYQVFPAVSFFKAKAMVQGNRVVIFFYIDEVAVGDTSVVAKLKNQIEKINLIERLNKATSSFVEDLCSQCHCLFGLGFRIWLKSRLKSYQMNYGLNDWRTAAIQAMLDNPHVDYALFKSISSHPATLIPGA